MNVVLKELICRIASGEGSTGTQLSQKDCALVLDTLSDDLVFEAITEDLED